MFFFLYWSFIAVFRWRTTRKCRETAPGVDFVRFRIMNQKTERNPPAKGRSGKNREQQIVCWSNKYFLLSLQDLAKNYRDFLGESPGVSSGKGGIFLIFLKNKQGSRFPVTTFPLQHFQNRPFPCQNMSSHSLVTRVGPHTSKSDEI